MMHIQKNRLKLCGIDKYLSGNFVSQAIGFRKPDSKFFEYVENNIPNFDKEKTLLVGDSLSADIAAAKYGYHTCYINRQNIAIPDDKIKPEFEINYFYELKKFFED